MWYLRITLTSRWEASCFHCGTVTCQPLILFESFEWIRIRRLALWSSYVRWENRLFWGVSFRDASTVSFWVSAILVMGVVLMRSGERGNMLWITNFEKRNKYRDKSISRLVITPPISGRPVFTTSTTLAKPQSSSFPPRIPTCSPRIRAQNASLFSPLQHIPRHPEKTICCPAKS